MQKKHQKSSKINTLRVLGDLGGHLGGILVPRCCPETKTLVRLTPPPSPVGGPFSELVRFCSGFLGTSFWIVFWKGVGYDFGRFLDDF